jgi:predicted ribonuclease YlaK
MTKYVVDTNVLVNDLSVLEGKEIVILSHVLRELEKHKSNRDKKDLAYGARKAVRWIDDHMEDDLVHFDLHDYTWNSSDPYENDYVDNLIVKACLERGYGLITNDKLLKFKALGFGIEFIEAESYESDEDDYTGVYEVVLSDEELAEFYENLDTNMFELFDNEYVVIIDKSGKYVDKYRWSDEHGYIAVKYNRISSKYLGEIRPRNMKQELLFNMLQDRKTTVKSCFGKFGTGKDFCMISHAVHLIENQKFQKIVFIRNQIPLKDAPESGFRKGDLFDKMIEFAMPLADHVGGVEMLRKMVEAGMVELQDLSRIRGRDLRNSIVYVTEAQNNTEEHVKLLLGRIGEGSELWLNGDLKQIDKDSFRHNSGIQAISKLKGHELYAQVTLDKTERSRTAELAELI